MAPYSEEGNMIQYENLYGSRTLCTTSAALQNYLCASLESLDNVITHLILNAALMNDGYYITPYVPFFKSLRPLCKNGKEPTTMTILDESSTYKVVIAAWDVRVVQRPYVTLNSLILEIAAEFKRVRNADKYEGVNNEI